MSFVSLCGLFTFLSIASQFPSNCVCMKLTLIQYWLGQKTSWKLIQCFVFAQKTKQMTNTATTATSTCTSVLHFLAQQYFFCCQMFSPLHLAVSHTCPGLILPHCKGTCQTDWLSGFPVDWTSELWCSCWNKSKQWRLIAQPTGKG